MLNGNSGNPSMVACTSSFTEAVTPTVTNGRVYRFARINNPTLVKETTHQNEFSLFPNPAVDKLFIKSSKPFSNEVITITGINGNVVYTSKLNEELDLKGLTKGIYFVHISRDESSVYNGKLILID